MLRSGKPMTGRFLRRLQRWPTLRVRNAENITEVCLAIIICLRCSVEAKEWYYILVWSKKSLIIFMSELELNSWPLGSYIIPRLHEYYYFLLSLRKFCKSIGLSFISTPSITECLLTAMTSYILWLCSVTILVTLTDAVDLRKIPLDSNVLNPQGISAFR